VEIYLDRYFRDRAGLLASLNAHCEVFNNAVEAQDKVAPFTLDGLNKLAFWAATGSGKTLLMHVNILQFRHYQAKSGAQNAFNRVILLTPNEGLSYQHLEEFRLSGVEADLFDKDKPSAFRGKAVEIIDVHKLREEAKEKTVAVDSFEGDNLVLVDEGHRGAGGVEWMDKRNRLCEGGFSFEYSATFGQAMKAAGNAALTHIYLKCILFDYSYKYFYSDGFGKEYRILNLADDHDDVSRDLYLTACLLAFYQQLRLFQDRKAPFARFLLHEPLCVFVGGSVNAVRTENRRQVSDVVDILLFLAAFASNKAKAVARLERLLRGEAVLRNAQGHNIFDNAFPYILRLDLDADALYDDMLKTVFNATASGKLHVENLKGADGEIALSIGTSEAPFGVINVGDTTALSRLCNAHDSLVVSERSFSGSLFKEINNADSPLKVLIGSKKFTEGWNSWRVSTMGLMNIGRTEGSEIIQLFGRGVRLKGFNFCLKRSREMDGVTPPEHIDVVETLNIFGVRADYMRQFKEYLEDEGLPTNDDMETLILPVVANLGGKRLKVPAVKEGIDFKRTGPKPTLDLPPDYLQRHPVILDWYPKVQAEVSRGLRTTSDNAVKEKNALTETHVAFLDIDALFFELVNYKNERSWQNINIPRSMILVLLANNSWYTLFIPKHELDFYSFDAVNRWQEIATSLLKKYCDRFYRYKKDEYERPNMELRLLSEEDKNFIGEGYRIMIEKSRTDIIEGLTQIIKKIVKGDVSDMEFNTFKSFVFDRHLYRPLVYCASDVIKVSPVALNEGERDFVLDLRTFCNNNPDFFADGRELYLLRNQSKGRGLGFFEAHNFYPDFIIWLLHRGIQHIIFVDPKGITRLEGLSDPKIEFYKTVKELEKQLSDPSIRMSSFIVSNTPLSKVKWWSAAQDRTEFAARNVLFQKEDQMYIKMMFVAACGVPQ